MKEIKTKNPFKHFSPSKVLANADSIKKIKLLV